MVDQMQTHYDEKHQMWTGAKASRFYDFDLSAGKIIHNTLKKWPKNVCQICLEDDRTVMNEEMLSWSVRVAQHFKNRGLRHDDVIGIVAKTSTYVAPVAVGCLFNATPFHAVNPVLEINTMKHVLAITKPKIIFCDEEQYEKIKEASYAWSPELFILIGNVDGVARVEELLAPTKTEMFYQPEKLMMGGDQTVAILCSSGTTGLPKAVCISNYAIPLGLSDIPSEAVLYSCSGLDWLTGVMYFILSVGEGCTRLISSKPFNVEYFLEIVEKYKVNITLLPPRLLSLILASPLTTPEKLSSLGMVQVGGGCISTKSLQQLQSLMRQGLVMFGYGCTETGGVSGNNSCNKIGNSSGQLMPGVRVRIVDDNGKNLRHGEVGELWVHNGRMWNGYYGNPLESRRMQDSLGWFHTGDLGYFDEDNNLFVVDRKKETCKYMGFHYWPGEIENTISELPDVVDVCVVGLYDESTGDRAAAMVERCSGSHLSAQDIKDHVAKGLVNEFKKLHGGVYFVDALPCNDNGKVLRRAVKEQLIKATLDR